jgi:hypothetical protein
MGDWAKSKSMGGRKKVHAQRRFLLLEICSVWKKDAQKTELKKIIDAQSTIEQPHVVKDNCTSYSTVISAFK